ncbi:GPI anchored protein [Hirsutella rhossiliensis]|uniref:GPI anchored protein n=1 Tax=Hirsutella rhossiliensis TaxID=111463 RepID=A0A9P8MVQ3_9HYPO|nr:GPI anchored protein [Hirsutella rhossiliensis]KAH0961912.1 GPI anchored protein [Hirsutella rhossiliensis]
MAPFSSTLLLLLPVLHASASQLTALRKLPPDAGHKISRHHLDFASQDSCAAEADAELLPRLNGTAACLRPAYGQHLQERDPGRPYVLRRALLEQRSSCPATMNSCADQGFPNKCCQEGTYCTDVPDVDVGRVACCPRGTQCGGQVASCPSEAVSCPQSLGGGCCIPGFVCRGFGCVPSPSSTALPQTPIQAPMPLETVTTTSTTMVEGSPSVVIVTMTVTTTSSPAPTTQTTTQVVTASDPDSATGSPPFRPTSSGASATTRDDSSTQSGCPTGFYGCLATHGGGCCRTDRDCNTHSCPPPSSSTTIMANGATVVVPAEGSPRDADATPTCAGGWFLCGESAGPVAGCCPSGFDCGTASCFAAQASQTGSVQKQAPRQSAGGCGGSDKSRAAMRKLLFRATVGACLWALAA